MQTFYLIFCEIITPKLQVILLSVKIERLTQNPNIDNSAIYKNSTVVKNDRINGIKIEINIRHDKHSEY